MSQEDDFLKSVLDEFGPIKPFKPSAYFDPDGNCIEFLLSNRQWRATVLDRWVTVYQAEDNDEIVGGLVKDISDLMEEYPGLDIEIKDSVVEVACVLRAPAWTTADPVKKKTYTNVIQGAEEAQLHVKYAPCA